jgi:hypothetical protein
MGVLTIDIAAQENQPPNQSGWLSLRLLYNTTHIFTLNNFTTETTPEYVDPEGDALEAIKIISLPSQGLLKLNGVAINAGDEISSAQLSGSNFIYESDAADTDGYSTNATFTVSDAGSSTFTTSPEILSIAVAYDTASQNQAPDSVGNGEEDITLGDIYVFTRASLTSSLNPPYHDPEGNPAYKILIDVVPSYGELRLNGVTVVSGQEILFTDIDLGLFSYVSESFPGSDLEGFEFRISDTVSKEYTG